MERPATTFLSAKCCSNGAGIYLFILTPAALEGVVVVVLREGLAGRQTVQETDIRFDTL